MPTLNTQPALFWGQREGTSGGQLSGEHGAGRLKQAGAPPALLAHWFSSKGPVIYGCRSLSLYLAGKSFLDKWGPLKRKQGEEEPW